MILFMDFDYVLHPEGEGHLSSDGTDFCFLPRLEALLREFPNVKIVISSSWREQLRYETLLKPFSDDIRARIIGAPPPREFGPPTRSPTAKERSSPGCNFTMRSMSPGWRSTMPNGSSTAARTIWWCAARLSASTTRPAPTFAGTSKEHFDESTDPFRPPSRVRALRVHT